MITALPSKVRIIVWGTYDTSKPRVRLLSEGLRKSGAELIECHASLWDCVDDKSQLSKKAWIGFFVKWIASYPSLIFRYFHLPKHDAILIPYLGQVDIIVFAFINTFRRKPVIWDAFLSLYDAVVNDRKMVSRYNPLAWTLYLVEWISSRLAHGVFLDTQAHARYFESLFHLKTGSAGTVLVGAERKWFCSGKSLLITQKDTGRFKVLFYGQFIPLQGTEVIVRAADLLQKSDSGIRWILLGKGQESPRIDRMIIDLGITTITRIEWAEYEQLSGYIDEASVCLGIFGTTDKARRVIPNKIYQIIMAGKPVITADTPAIRELVKNENSFIRLISPGDPKALASAVLDFKQNPPCYSDEDFAPFRIDAEAVGKQAFSFIHEILSGVHR
jgi:glycosyltransferase involved in cell wall biosynthesis